MLSFEGFMRIDAFLRSVYRLMYLNFLWLVTTLVGLVVVGVGPATYALARYMDRWVRFGETPPPTRTFLAHLREQPLRAMRVSWILLAAGTVILTNVFLAPNWYLQFFNILALVVLGIVAAYVYPLMAATDLATTRQLLSGALMVGLGSLHWTILGASASAGTLWLMWQAAPLLAGVFGIGVPALAVALVTRVVLREFTLPTPDRAEADPAPALADAPAR